MNSLLLLGLLALAQAQTLSDTTSTASNFCNMKTCSRGSSVACSFTYNTNMKCPEGKTFTFDKDSILKKHNDYRQIVASGRLADYEPAQRMVEMQYSEELAQMALYNVKKCIYGHDQCRSTTTFPNSGQNLGITWPWPQDSVTIDSRISRLIDSWFNEYLKCNMGEIEELKDSKNCGHFTQLVQEKSTHVGCAVGTFLRKGNINLYFACNYAVGNLSPSYVGGEIASECTARSTTYDALCSEY